MRLAISVSLTVVLLSAASANALVLDQVSPTGAVSYNMNNSGLTWQQQVTVGLAGPLVQVDLRVQQAGTAQFFINTGTPWQSDTHDFVTTFTTGLNFAWVPIDTSSSGLNFNVGDKFVIGVKGTNGGMSLFGTYANPGGGYAGGDLWLNNSLYSPSEPGNYDLAFRTYIPEPATVILFVAGGLALCARRSKP